MPQFLSSIGNDQFIDVNGDPLTGGQIETYLEGSSTPAATYTSSSGAVAQANPIILNSLGYAPSPVWLTGGIGYKFIVKDAGGSTLRTIDNISGINDASVSQSEWVESGLVPTYISATSFSVPGDQTPTLQIGRRVRTTNTSGLVYSTISNSVFAAGITTVTVTNDSTTLDAGLSLVAYALLAATPLSVPNLPASKITGQLAIANGGTGQATAALAFTALKQAASETDTGVVEKLTTAEAQTGTDDTRYHSAATMKAAQIILGTAVASTSGVSIDFTGIPSFAKEVCVYFDALSTSGTSALLLQIGDSGGIENSGYASVAISSSTSGVVGTSTAGFALTGNNAGTFTHSGFIQLRRMNGNTWACTGLLTQGTTQLSTNSGAKTLSAALDRVRITTAGGSDTFDAGTLNVSWS